MQWHLGGGPLFCLHQIIGRPEQQPVIVRPGFSPFCQSQLRPRKQQEGVRALPVQGRSQFSSEVAGILGEVPLQGIHGGNPGREGFIDSDSGSEVAEHPLDSIGRVAVNNMLHHQRCLVVGKLEVLRGGRREKGTAHGRNRSQLSAENFFPVVRVHLLAP